MELISANMSPPNSEMIPATSHTSKSMGADPVWAAMVAGFIKIPEPMILPTTMDTDVWRPILGDDIICEWVKK
jgi:hypothetical protein